MSIRYSAPFVGKDAFDVVGQGYATFPTRSDAMLASLLLSYQVTYHAMSLLLGLIKHPDFNHKEVSLNSPRDILHVAEEARIKRRSAVVQRRSLNDEGQMIQTRFPQFILSEVLDFLEKEREDELFGPLYRDLEFRPDHRKYPNDSYIRQTFHSLSLVHRSWTDLAQKSLARIAYPKQSSGIGPFVQVESLPAIYGPWTNNIVLVEADRLVTEPWKLEALSTSLLRIPNKLKHLVLQTARRESPGEAVIEIDSFVDNGDYTSKLQYLSLKNSVYRGRMMHADFSSLRGLRIMCSSGDTVRTFVSLLSCIALNPNSPFESLAILDIDFESAREMVRQELHSRCSSIWPRLRHLRLETQADSEGYHEECRMMLRSMVPLCTGLRKLGFTLGLHTMSEPTPLSSHLPHTIEELEIRITAGDHYDFYVDPEEWKVDILSELVESGWLPVLHTVHLICPAGPDPSEVESMVGDRSDYVQYEDKLQEVTEGARTECRRMLGDLVISWYDIRRDHRWDL